eukprot:SAG31_NODE_33373_length_344_cov_1.057143_1_plen_58_part_10
MLRLPFSHSKNVLWGTFPRVLAGDGHAYSRELGIASVPALPLLFSTPPAESCLRNAGH